MNLFPSLEENAVELVGRVCKLSLGRLIEGISTGDYFVEGFSQ